MAKIDDVVNSLQYHRLDPESGASVKFEALREAAIEFATVINETTEENREQSLAFTHLEDSLMWAIKSIAIRM